MVQIGWRHDSIWLWCVIREGREESCASVYRLMAFHKGRDHKDLLWAPEVDTVPVAVVSHGSGVDQSLTVRKWSENGQKINGQK